MTASLFRPVSDETRSIMRSFHERRQFNFLVPSKFVSVESAQVGYLVNRLLGDGQEDLKSTFCNSRYEAAQVAIKLVRHHHYLNSNKQKKAQVNSHPVWPKVYHYSRSSHWLATLFNPLGVTSEQALVPNVDFFHSIQELAEAAKAQQPLAIMLSIADVQDLTDCHKQLADRPDCFLIVDVSALTLSQVAEMPVSVRALADIHILGEACSGHEIPFGAMVVRNRLHHPWASIDGCLSHTSTYGGGRIVLTKVRAELARLSPCISADVHASLNDIEQSKKAAAQAFHRYVNPGLIKLNAVMKFDCKPVQARGGVLTLDHNGKNVEVYDCVIGAGATCRGHFPADVVTNVLDRHEVETDYWSQLRAALSALTGFNHVLPSVSGATAVENAMLMAVTANKSRRKVVVFKQNYAGQTLVSLLGTALEDEQQKYRPLYADVVYFDLNKASLISELDAMLCSGEVALVWLETVQGSSVKAVPDEVLALIESRKEAGKYLIGIDEILLSFYRTSGVFHYSGLGIHPDLVTVSKALSDGVMPIGVTFVADKVFRQCQLENPTLVSTLEQLYINQFSSHVALNLLNGLAGCPDMEKARVVLKEGFRKIELESSVIDSITGDGFMYSLKYSPQGKCQRTFGALGAGLFPLFMYRKLLLDANIYVYIDRIIFPVNLTEQDARTIIERLHAILTTDKHQRRQFMGFVARLIFGLLFRQPA